MLENSDCHQKKNMVEYYLGATVLQGGLTSHFLQNGGDAYEKSF